jgi:Mn-dependent DtxR family transcriptional regulator
MTSTRHDVFEALVEATEAADSETTSPATLASTLGADTETVDAHLRGLADCGLARRYGEGRVRVTVTGEALAELDVDDVVVVSPTRGDDE